MDKSEAVRRWRKWIIILLVTIISVLSFGVAALNQSVAETKKVGESNNRFLANFSDYMRCLVINDEEVVVAVGEETYFNLCDELLFRSTGLRPNPTKVTIPPNLTSTTTTTIGG